MSLKPTKMFVATKAFIVNKNNGKVLIIKESAKYSDGTNMGCYDVVGGRVELGQRFDESLLREIKEETGLTDIILDQPFFVNEWRPQVDGEMCQIIGIFFKCSTTSNKVALGNDHDNYKWINPRNYKEYNIIKDLEPIFEVYLNNN